MPGSAIFPSRCFCWRRLHWDLPSRSGGFDHSGINSFRSTIVPLFSRRLVMTKKANIIDGQVGNRVRIRRMLIGMSQEKLGDLLGLTFQQVQKYEKGINRIGAGRLFEISRILGVPIEFFYEGVAGAQAGEFADTHSAPVMEFVSSGEGLQLSLAFMKIKDPKVRKRMLDLVKSLAEEEAE